jgi:hypothetical protein
MFSEENSSAETVFSSEELKISDCFQESIHYPNSPTGFRKGDSRRVKGKNSCTAILDFLMSKDVRFT